MIVFLKLGRLEGAPSNEFSVIRRCWNRCLKKTNTGVPISSEIHIRMLTSLPHNWNWRNLQEWEEAGLTKVGDIYREGELLPFNELSREFELPQGDFLLHGAITAAIR